MPVQSGVRPYAYTRDPFVVATNEKVGFSGVFFEEPMFVIIAERDIYTGVTGDNRKFTKYINDGANITARFEPDPSGRNLTGNHPATPLTGVEAGPACVNFVDYIQDLRDALSGLCLTYIATDSDYSGIQIINDYMQSHLGQSNWVHPNVASLSGGIYDKDLDEVMYNPYPRVSKYTQSSGGIGPKPMYPIFPSFISKTGGMVNVLARDLAHSYNITGGPPGFFGSGYAAADAGKFLIAGDGFAVTTSKLRLGYSLINQFNLMSSATGTCSAVYTRQINKPLAGGLGEFSAPAINIASGLYGISVQGTTSGTIGIWPRMEAYQTFNFGASGYRIDYPTNGNVTRASGIHVFNTGFWAYAASGANMYSPINGQTLWLRFADQTSFQTAIMTAAVNYASASPSNDSDTLLYAGTRATGTFPSYQEYWFFGTWDKTTLTFQTSNQVGPFTTADSASVVFVAGDMTTHSPASGQSLAGYTIINARESSDNFLRPQIYDGASNRGSLFPLGSWGTAEAAPEILGCINGHAYARSTLSPGGAPSYTFWHVEIEAIHPTFPLPASSGISPGGFMLPYDSRQLVYAATIQHHFEQMAAGNFTLPGICKIIQPKGEFNTGDGSALINFQAKPKGASTQFSYVGRVSEATSGSTQQLQITEYWGPMGGTVDYMLDFTS